MSTHLDPTTVQSELVADLTKLVAIPSIGFQPEHAPDVLACAKTVAEMFEDLGCPDVRVIEGPAAPAVIARFPAPAGQPTICLYAHHDVQPIGDLTIWETEPLTATLKGDRLYGRGTSDDKAGVALHLAAMRAFGGKPPVGVTVFIEGEEEIGSPSSERFLEEYADLLDADLYVIADSGNWAVGQPAFTTTLRGVCDCYVEVRTLEHAVHSGQFGGPVPDALTTLCHLLATLHDDQGNVAIDGLKVAYSFDVDYTEDQLRAESSLRPGVQAIGDGSITDRLWAKPSCTVIGIDAPTVAVASNTLVPTAKAMVSLRVPPGMEANDALDCLVKHLETHAPWGAEVTVTRHTAGNPGIIPVDGKYAQIATAAWTDAFGVAPVHMGQGGTIPLTGDLQARFPNAEVLVTAVSDPDSRPHSPNESVHIGDLVKYVQAEVDFLERAANA